MITDYYEYEKRIYNIYLDSIFIESRAVKIGKTLHLTPYPVEDSTYITTHCNKNGTEKELIVVAVPLPSLCKKCILHLKEVSELSRDRSDITSGVKLL